MLLRQFFSRLPFSCLLLFLMLLLPACSGRQLGYKNRSIPLQPKPNQQQELTHRGPLNEVLPVELEMASDTLREYEARLVDVSIPMGGIPVSAYRSQAGGTCLVYSCKDFSLEQTQLFFQSEMERSGWRQVAVFMTYDNVLMTFHKPQRFCTVIGRQSLVKQRCALELSIYMGSF